MSLSNVIDHTLSVVPIQLAYAAVFALPALEASVFAGFVIPGETAIIFGGVLASQHHANLAVVLLLAIAGAIIGDSVGYEVGARYGHRLKATRLGQLVGEQRWRQAEAFVHRRSAPAVFFGRFTAILRALVPASAGTARVPYRKFLFWNVLGGTCWAVGFVMLGFLLGDTYHRVEHALGRASFLLLLFVVVLIGLRHVVHRNHERPTPVSPLLDVQGSTSHD